MKTVDVVQGTDAWKTYRSTKHTASEAPAMMGASDKFKRNDLVRMKATGSEEEYSRFVEEVLFARGHTVEAATRPIVERLLGVELYPATGESDDYPQLSASFDGIDMAETIVWEGKQWNEAKAALVRAGNVPPEDYWQCVQQLVVSGAERLVYTVSDGTEERTLHCEMRLSAADQKRLLDSWKQFDEDVKSYIYEAPTVAAVGRAPESLPALRIEVTGMVTASNLELFKDHAIAVFRGINTDLKTDQDFADADRTIKWCGEIETKLKAAKDHALSQTQSIDQLFRTIDDIGAEARAKRLELEKLVKARKDSIRIEITQRAKHALIEHYQTINATLGGVTLGVPLAFPADLATAIKGRKTVVSVQDAADIALANAKIEASATADRVRINLEILNDAGHLSLFADRHQLATAKAPDDLRNLVTARIAEHEEAEAEAEARAQRDTERMIERIREEKRARAEAAQRTQPDNSTPVEAEAPAAVTIAASAPHQAAADGQMVRLGNINAMIAPLSISFDGLAALGYPAVGTDRAAKLYLAADVPKIIAAMIAHLQKSGTRSPRMVA